jgi:CRP/FNR family cyclic AMP-dependent transcriptional regulator
MNKGVASLILRSLPVFSGLNEQRLAALALEASLKSVARNEVVLHEGDVTDNVYFVLAGGLKVLVSDDEGREVILSMLGPGDVFGELSVLDDHPRSATVVAVESSKLVVFAKLDFLRCLADNFDIALLIMRGMAARLRLADQRIESLALLDVYGRVARLLLELSESCDGMQVVTRRLTKQDIAKMVGASREMVSRVMKDLARHGLIEERDGGIYLIGETGDSQK